MRYIDRRVNYFDFCLVDAMSMIEVTDMINELWFKGRMRCFWKSSKGGFSNDVVRPLVSDFDVVNMVATIPRNHYLHMNLDDKGNGGNEPPIKVDSDMNVNDDVHDDMHMSNSESESKVRNECGTSTGFGMLMMMCICLILPMITLILIFMKVIMT